MGCRTFGVIQIMVGLHKVGLVGLKDVFLKIEKNNLKKHEEILDLISESLETDNYIPQKDNENFRQALWREYLRFLGEDYSDFYSNVPVTVLGNPGEKLNQFIDLKKSVFNSFELNPIIALVSDSDITQYPQLIVDDQVIADGSLTSGQFKSAVRKSFSDW